MTKASSRRRPVSVDCEVQYNVSEGGSVASGQGQEMEVDPEREAVLPSKNTKPPMTVSELRRGLDFYSSDLPQKGCYIFSPCSSYSCE